MSETTYKMKLIEVAIPLEAINKASAREKSIRHSHPSTLHLWWPESFSCAARPSGQRLYRSPMSKAIASNALMHSARPSPSS